MSRTVISAGSSSGGSTGYPTSNNPFTGPFGTGQSMVFGNSQNWTVPTGVTSVRVRLWGAGGGGATSGASQTGGGGGGFALKVISDLTPGSVIPITIGEGGATSTPGGTTSFGTYVSATGGEAATNSSTHAGGTGVGGDINNTGGSAVQTYGGGGGVASLFGNGNDGRILGTSFKISGGAGGGVGHSNAVSAEMYGTRPPGLGTMSNSSGGASSSISTYLYTADAISAPLTSMDMIGTGHGGVGGSGSFAVNGGGGGGYYTTSYTSNGGFPGGGGGAHQSGVAVYGADGLVIVEY